MYTLGDELTNTRKCQTWVTEGVEMILTGEHDGATERLAVLLPGWELKGDLPYNNWTN